MIWLDRLLGRPTEPVFLADVWNALHRTALGELQHDVPGDRIVVTNATGGRLHFFLGNLHHDWAAAPRAGRAEVIARHLRSIPRGAGEGMPASYDEARTSLRPVLRHAHALANDLAELEVLSEPGEARRGIVVRPWVGELALLLMLDRPESMMQVPLTTTQTSARVATSLSHRSSCFAGTPPTRSRA